MASHVPITNIDRLLPDVDSRVFDGREVAAFWVGLVANKGTIQMPDEYAAVLKLRANVYIDELQYLPEEARGPHGQEVDDDDIRSVQFAILEKNGFIEPRAVGTGRLIIKRDKDDKLPVERLYPEVFANRPAEVGAVEGSRLIARHPDQFRQNLLGLASIRALDFWALENGVPYIYGMAEKPLLRYLSLNGFPYEQLSDFKEVEDYGDTLNAAIRFEPRKVAEIDQLENSRRRVFKEFFEEAADSYGLGYFDMELKQLRTDEYAQS